MNAVPIHAMVTLLATIKSTDITARVQPTGRVFCVNLVSTFDIFANQYEYVYNKKFLFTNLFKIDLNTCRSSPCVNQGSCSNTGADNYVCNCIAGYTGSQCQISESCTHQQV